MIDLARLIAAGIAPTQARAFLEPILQTCDRFDIDAPQREAAFVAQCSHESSGFTDMEEGLFYRDPARIMKIFPSTVKSLTHASTLVGNPEALANTVYAGRNGNGPFASGDGFRYRGRGLIQLTGRANYTAAALALGEPYIDHPEHVATPPDACLTAGWYWDRTRCNLMADASDIDGITRAINGPGMAGANDRRLLYSRALQAFR
jgi:putative chitinase